MEFFSDNIPFFKGNTHTHTTLSDGRKAPEEVIALYREHGYDFLALTDHNRLGAPTKMLDNGMLFLSGLEMDYTLDKQVVHMTVIGVDPAFGGLYQHGGDPQADIELARAHGGRVFLCHPAWSLNTPEQMMALEHLSGVEIYNTMSGTPWNAGRADSSGVIDLAATRGWLVPHIAADDAHFYQGEQCVSSIMVQAEELSWESLRAAIDQGRFYATQGPTVSRYGFDGSTIRVECSAVEQIVFYSNAFWVAGRCREGRDLTSAEYQVRGDETYVRCQLIDKEGRSAWLSPIDMTK